MAIKLEMGKRYVNRDGELHGPMVAGRIPEYPFQCPITSRTFTPNGVHYIQQEGHALDLVAEVTEPETVAPTPEEPTPEPEPVVAAVPPAEPAPEVIDLVLTDTPQTHAMAWPTFVADTSARLLAAAETTLPQRFHGPSMNQEMATRAVSLALELVTALETAGVVFIKPTPRG